MQSTMTIENLQNLKDRVADLSTLTDQLQRMIDITQRTQELTRQLTDATHDMNAHTRQMRDNANELRDRIADFDDFWRPLKFHVLGAPLLRHSHLLVDALLVEQHG